MTHHQKKHVLLPLFPLHLRNTIPIASYLRGRKIRGYPRENVERRTLLSRGGREQLDDLRRASRRTRGERRHIRVVGRKNRGVEEAQRTKRGNRGSEVIRVRHAEPREMPHRAEPRGRHRNKPGKFLRLNWGNFRGNFRGIGGGVQNGFHVSTI